MNRDKLREMIHYDNIKGKLYWRNNYGTRARIGKEAGCIDSKGYRVVTIKGERYKAHRLIWLMEHGDLPYEHIDHIDGDVSNNVISNLRQANTIINGRNQKINKLNKTGITGVYFIKNEGRWVARIGIGAKSPKYIGSSNNFFEICCIRKSAEFKYGYHENHGRGRE